MEPFRYHLYICNQQKPEGAPSCAACGSGKIVEVFRREVAARGLEDKVQITVCGSLGLCERGPNLVVYPEGIWYSGVKPEDVAEIVRSHLEQGCVVERLVNTDAAALKAEIQSNRNKMLTAQRAKDAAGVLPDDLNATLRGFMESRVILTAVELDVFTAVAEGATAAQVAERRGTTPRATEMLLNALVAMGLLMKQGEVFHLTPVTRRFFVAGSPDDARAATMHTVNLWRRWSILTECVRAGTAVAREEAVDRDDKWTESFIAAMHRIAAERAPLIVRAVGTGGVECMLDVGGGSGAYSIAFAKASERLRADLLDLGTVISIARGHIEKAGLAQRITIRAGDLRTDKFGGGYNLVLVSSICHMLSPEENQDLFRRCRAALAPNGRIVVQEFILEPDKTAPKWAALFSLNMLVGTKCGSSYSQLEYAAWLRAAGFEDVHRMYLPGPSGLMLGTRR